VTGLARFAAFAGCAAALMGCSALLPKARTEVASPWKSFDEAKAAIESIVPGGTSVTELRARGIDPYTSPNVQLLSYSDILRRFPLDDGARWEKLDPGLRDCLEAGKSCSGFEITLGDIQRKRVGPFIPDLLRFKQIVDVSGWTFNALILMVDDRVVYTLYGGQPSIRTREMTRNPLGPAQDLGKALPSTGS
jgi:hypothetical protein